ncbi:MAG TPA: hypothetical protein VLB04_04645 [Methanotrichaceae archaeon]|nr:hypothetical protein [Methanotrichaceae archaeon]
MICLRCGYCCTCLDIAIVNPISILPDGTIDPCDSSAVVFKPSGQRCPHLQFREDEAVCTIHHLPCYKETPCDQFEQFGPEDSVCVLGSYFKALDQSRKAKISQGQTK